VTSPSPRSSFAINPPSSFPSSSMRQEPRPSRPLVDNPHYYPRSLNRYQYYAPAEFFYTSQRLPQQHFRSASFHAHHFNDRVSSHHSSKFISAHSTAVQASSQPGTSHQHSHVTSANPYEVRRVEAPHLSIHNPRDRSPVRGRCSRRVLANSTSVARVWSQSQAPFFSASSRCRAGKRRASSHESTVSGANSPSSSDEGSCHKHWRHATPNTKRLRKEREEEDAIFPKDDYAIMINEVYATMNMGVHDGRHSNREQRKSEGSIVSTTTTIIGDGCDPITGHSQGSSPQALSQTSNHAHQANNNDTGLYRSHRQSQPLAPDSEAAGSRPSSYRLLCDSSDRCILVENTASTFNHGSRFNTRKPNPRPPP
jgi:hypothetical protein